MEAHGTLLVIGANRGIGFQLATRFQAKGYDVYGTYRGTSRADESVANASHPFPFWTLRNSGVTAIELDLTDEVSITRSAEEFGDRPLDVLINCAGLYYTWDDKPFTDQSAEDLMTHFKVNVVGPFLVSKAFLPAVRRASSGKIINVSSDYASIADNDGGNACYRISKAGVNQLTKTMAMDLAGAVQTLAVHPGYVPTKMTGFYGVDDMETCMAALVDVIERFGTDRGKDLPNGGYVRWNGQVMRY